MKLLLETRAVSCRAELSRINALGVRLASTLP
jgi:hypothetical protein